jgi:site-specific DNA-methyltransferase (adenine-specific)
MNDPVIIGDCTLYLGDCLEVMPTLEKGSVDFVFTDPPYGHNNNNGDLIARREAALGKGDYDAQRDDRPIANDGKEANEIFRLALHEFNRLLSPGCCCCCCCCGGGPDPQFARWSLWMDEIIGFKQMVVYDKGPMGMGWHYRRSYETVLVGEKPGAACRWYDKTKRIENIIRKFRKIIPSSEQHPTEKPIELGAHFIQLHTLPGHTVLDPFMGSGTTGVACVQTGRKFIGIEIDPNYFEIACKRIRDASQQMRLPFD